jgi:hypothetical protein
MPVRASLRPFPVEVIPDNTMWFSASLLSKFIGRNEMESMAGMLWNMQHSKLVAKLVSWQVISVDFLKLTTCRHDVIMLPRR